MKENLKMQFKIAVLLCQECGYNYPRSLYMINRWKAEFNKIGIFLSSSSHQYEIKLGSEITSKDLTYISLIFASKGYRNDYIKFESFDHRRRFNRDYLKFKKEIELWK